MLPSNEDVQTVRPSHLKVSALLQLREKFQIKNALVSSASYRYRNRRRNGFLKQALLVDWLTQVLER